MGILFFPRTTIMETLSYNRPLFSSIVTLCTLILMYSPHVFVLVISPLLVSTLTFFLFLLRFLASQRIKQPLSEGVHELELAPELKPELKLARELKPQVELVHELKPELEPTYYKKTNNQSPIEQEKPEPKPKLAKLQCHRAAQEHTALKAKPNPSQYSYNVKHDQEKEIDLIHTCATNQYSGRAESKPMSSPKLFLNWDVGAPLEVIYEAYEEEKEGEEVQNDTFSNNGGCKAGTIIEKYYPSLSGYYPESDSDTDLDSDSDSNSNLESSSSTISWDEYYDDEKEGLIEITLDNYGYYDNKGIINMIMQPNNNIKLVDYYQEVLFEDDDNFIEIDISPHQNYVS